MITVGDDMMYLTKKGYRVRIVDSIIQEHLKTFAAVCIEGPKWCGKTWTALNNSKSVIYIGNPNNNFQNRMLAELNPEFVLEGEFPRLIDEWQEVPPLWDAVRFKVDQSIQKGQYILTGSATPKRKGILHSGAGRINTLLMRPMSLYESGDSTGLVSLIDLFTHHFSSTPLSEVSLKHLIYLTCRGGWPGSINLDEKQAINVTKSYLEMIINDDVSKVDQIGRNKKKIQYLIKSLARNTSTIVSTNTLANDIKEFYDDTITSITITEYLDVLTRLFILEDQSAFDMNYRSNKRVAKSPKRHFIDPSLAIAALDLSSDKLLQDLNFYGFLFESMVIRDLRVYAEVYGGTVMHYKHFDTNVEIDAVVELSNGEWGAFEIKLGMNQVDSASANLLKMQKSIIENGKGKPPVFLAVICGLAQAAYLRSDSVYVIPITSLKN